MAVLDRVVVLSLVLSAASAGLAMRAASPSLRFLRAEREQAEQRLRLLKRIVTTADRFDTTLDPSDDLGRIDDTRGSREIRQAVNDFRQAAVRLRDLASDRQSSAFDVEEVLRLGSSIDVTPDQLSVQAEQAWLSLRADLDRLARAHAVTWNGSDGEANSPVVPPEDGTPRRPATSR
jgi:hypothetical protein